MLPCLRLVPLCLFIAASQAVENDYDDAGGRSGWGAFMVPVPLSQQARLDLEPGQGVTVVHVRPAGTASSLGIQAGDIVLDINGIAAIDRRAVRSAVRAAEPGSPVEARILSNGSETVVAGTFQKRQPRPPGFGPPPWAVQPSGNPGSGLPPIGPPPFPGGPAGFFDRTDPVEAQREQLLIEQRQLAEAKADLAAARAALGDQSKEPAWFIAIAIATPRNP
ncbi:hypothetical protein LBMAG53_08300 [Planctomycetota bacterium]|nr:hypothetical protein LBMAG53_08300 [Planctomycetota bacterium]